MSDENQLDLSGGRTRLTHGLVIAAVMSFTGVVLLVFGEGILRDHHLIGLVIFALAGAVVLLAQRQAKAAPVLRLEEEGIWYRAWGQTVAWRELGDCYIGGSRLRPLLVLKLKDPEAFLARRSADQRRALARCALVRLPELRIPGSAAGANLLPLRDFILDRLRGRRP